MGPFRHFNIIPMCQSRFIYGRHHCLRPPNVKRLLPPTTGNLMLLRIHCGIQGQDKKSVFHLFTTQYLPRPLFTGDTLLIAGPFYGKFRYRLRCLSFRFLAFRKRFVRARIRPILVTFVQKGLITRNFPSRFRPFFRETMFIIVWVPIGRFLFISKRCRCVFRRTSFGLSSIGEVCHDK